MKSCLYTGTLRHRRHEPRPREFSYSLFMMYLDLAELPTLFDRYWLWSTRRAAPARFDRRDYHGDAGLSLDTAVRDSVQQATGQRPAGPIRLLTHLRYFGYIMNPVSFYYCFDADDSRVEAIVAEITNTPWHERHAYVLRTADAERRGRVMRFGFDKQFHVSPFWPMDMRYDWRLSVPDERLQVHMENWHEGRRAFDATLAMRRKEISSASLAAALSGYPFVTAKVGLAIYAQALRLWLRRTPFFAHPGSTVDRLREMPP